MFELVTNLIVYGTLGGVVLIVTVTVASVIVKVAARLSVRNLPLSMPHAAVPTDVCRYCGFKLAESKCDHCGGSNPQFVTVET
jgi:hypothetical protein